MKSLKKVYCVIIINFISFIFNSSILYGMPTVPDNYTVETWLINTSTIRGVEVGPGGEFGTNPYIWSGSKVSHVTGKDTASTFANGVYGNKGKIEFDISGRFGNDMFVNTIYNRGEVGTDPIYRVTPDGQESTFFGGFWYGMDGIAFGQGNGFGTDLYIRDSSREYLLRFKPDGSWTPFGSGVLGDPKVTTDGEDDMIISSGGQLGNYVYMTDAWGRAESILRTLPSGITETFVSGRSGIALAIGEASYGDYLFLGTGYGEVYHYDGNGQETLFASGFDGRIRSMDIDGDNMWVATENKLYKINTVVPEPVSSILFFIGSAIFAGVSYLRKKII